VSESPPALFPPLFFDGGAGEGGEGEWSSSSPTGADEIDLPQGQLHYTWTDVESREAGMRAAASERKEKKKMKKSGDRKKAKEGAILHCPARASELSFPTPTLSE